MAKQKYIEVGTSYTTHAGQVVVVDEIVAKGRGYTIIYRSLRKADRQRLSLAKFCAMIEL